MNQIAAGPKPMPRHDPLTQGLHWLTALSILVAFGTSMLMEELPRGAFKAQVLGGHVSLGLVVFVSTGLLLLLRAWRGLRGHSAPPTGWLWRLARLSHGLLYALMVAAPLLGLLMMWSKGREVAVFGLFVVPSPLPADRALGRAIGEAHEAASNALVLLAGLHAAAAIFHQLVLRDGLMQRMLPARGPLRFPR